MPQSREIHLVRYPDGLPAEDIFAEKKVDIAAPGPGEVLMRTVWMSVDPYMRGRMRPKTPSYMPSFRLGEVLDGAVIAQVMAGQTENLKVGDYVVSSTGGWREFWLTRGDGLHAVDPTIAPLSTFLGVLGMPGFTAWAGIENILKPLEGEILFVSGGAGAVGSLACQIGKLRGCTVIASAGTDDKCSWLKDELGVDVVLNYKKFLDADALSDELHKHAPNGVNCYFENVGGMHLQAAIGAMAPGGRIALCGYISVYNNRAPDPGPNNLTNMIVRRLSMRGFLVSEYAQQLPNFLAEMVPAVSSGNIKYRETAYDGLERAPQAFAGLFRGENIGKALVRVGPDSL